VLELKNKCLLSKWLFKLLNEEGVWQELLRNKYLNAKTLSQVQAKPTDSQFWKGLMMVKDEFFTRGYFKVGDGRSIRFWEDVWLGDSSLTNQCPSLYNIAQRENVLVAKVLQHTPLNMAFRRNLHGHTWARWIHLCTRLMLVQLNENTDAFVWKLNDNGLFSVKSMYLDMMNGHTRFLRK
jgi:hypothetical protein